ncbi:MAG: NAD(P)-dependent oxidoreductase, partial [Planctomycetota bacterium]
YRKCYIISLHCPLIPQTHHLIDDGAIEKMRDCVMLINTSRGALIDTIAAIKGLKSGKIGYLGLDVYEEEGDLFFEDLSNKIIQDDVFARLLMFPNVIVTGHQAFFTHNAVQAIAETTLSNIAAYERGECQNILTCSKVKKA